MASLIPHHRHLVRRFTEAVTSAVEATIVARTRKLLADRKPGRAGRLGAGVRTLDVDPAGTWPTLAEHQWSYIQQVLERTHGNRSEAAVILGLHRRSLQRLLARGRRRTTRARPRGRKRR
jgi:DNA-binding NtrC family response regulator